MATNFILPFATGAGANVLDDDDWAVSDVLAQGFQQGRAASKKYNKAFRQSTAVASGVGQFTADYSGLDFTDSLSPQAMRDNFRMALAAAMDGARMGADVSTVANQLTFPITPLPPTLSGNRVIYFKPNVTNTGAATATILKSDGTPAFSALSIKRRDGFDPQSGDLVAGVWYGATCDGAALRLLSVTKSEIIAIVTGSSGGSYTPPTSANENNLTPTADKPVTNNIFSIVPVTGTAPVWATLAASGLLTITQAGIYTINAVIQFSSTTNTTTTTYYAATIQKNGNAYSSVPSSSGALANTPSLFSVAYNQTIFLNVGDTLGLYGQVTAGSGILTAGSITAAATYLHITKSA